MARTRSACRTALGLWLAAGAAHAEGAGAASDAATAAAPPVTRDG